LENDLLDGAVLAYFWRYLLVGAVLIPFEHNLVQTWRWPTFGKDLLTTMACSTLGSDPSSTRRYSHPSVVRYREGLNPRAARGFVLRDHFEPPPPPRGGASLRSIWYARVGSVVQIVPVRASGSGYPCRPRVKPRHPQPALMPRHPSPIRPFPALPARGGAPLPASGSAIAHTGIEQDTRGRNQVNGLVAVGAHLRE
jgi:hypothetical protein